MPQNVSNLITCRDSDAAVHPVKVFFGNSQARHTPNMNDAGYLGHCHMMANNAPDKFEIMDDPLSSCYLLSENQ